MNNFNWKEFKQGNIAIHCNTLEKAEDFLKKCHNKGMNWIYDDSLLEENMWYDYKENTCYEYDNNIFYCSLNYYKNNKYQIIEWEI